ncbi:MAG: GspH/FimT family pseudopilin [Hylemonella sp.]|jgi:type IV fimbrial biogenesis protein FimT
MRSYKSCAGATLIESMVVILLAGLLASLAAPWLSGFVNSMRVRSTAQTLHASLQLARSESAKRNTRVVVCKSSDGAQCASGGAWEQGWLIFVDANNNASVDPGEPVLRVEKGVASSLRASGNGLLASYVSYTPWGVTQTIGGAYQIGTFTLCSQSNSSTEGRQIVIGSSGRVRTQKASLSSCA